MVLPIFILGVVTLAIMLAILIRPSQTHAQGSQGSQQWQNPQGPQQWQGGQQPPQWPFGGQPQTRTGGGLLRLFALIGVLAVLGMCLILFLALRGGM
jgi:hypothetical protein